MVIWLLGRPHPIFISQLSFLGNGLTLHLKKKKIIQEALEPSFVDTGGGVLEKIRMEQINTCMHGRTN